MADLAVRHQVIGTDQIAIVDVGFGYELVDLDGTGGFQRDVLKLVLRHLDIGVGVDLVALHDIVGRDFLAGVGVDLGIFDAMAGLAVDLIEADLLGIRGCRIQSDRAGHERKAQKAFPVSAGGHGILRKHSRRPVTIPPGNPDSRQAGRESPNGVNRAGEGSVPGAGVGGPTGTSLALKTRNIIPDHALLSIPRRKALSRSQESRPPWQYIKRDGSSKPRPRPAGLNPARRYLVSWPSPPGWRC
jgi:hypothetical protein